MPRGKGVGSAVEEFEVVGWVTSWLLRAKS